VPADNDRVATDNGGGTLMVILSVALATTPPESETCRVKLEVPSAVGVPEMTTESVVLEDRVKPAGRFPDVCVQVNVPVAPPALTTPK